jgi:hypothetical protein
MSLSDDFDDTDKPEPMTPRADFDHAFLFEPAFCEFTQHDRSAGYQVIQNLQFLGDDKARKLIDFLAKQRGFGL